jgi:acetoin utilization deacetylase AcuC-like enzyme
LPAAIDDDGYLVALSAVLDSVAAFGPDLLVVSLGVDTYVDDPMADFAVTTEGFGGQGAAVAALGVPMVVLQEGGYDVATIGANVRAFLLGATVGAEW